MTTLFDQIFNYNNAESLVVVSFILLIFSLATIHRIKKALRSRRHKKTNQRINAICFADREKALRQQVEFNNKQIKRGEYIAKPKLYI